MDTSAIMAFASAVFAVTIAIIVAWHERRLIANWSFLLGMAALAAESICAGMAADALPLEQIVFWQKWKFVAMALLPSVWLFFSLTYARGNYREFLLKWRIPLVGFSILPIVLATAFNGSLINSVVRSSHGEHWILRLGAAGIILYLLLLVAAVLILMNLERTFRAAVGTMQWRIKFVILGLGLLFAVRAYTSSQVLLFRGVNLSLQGINSGALLLACSLMLRSLFRMGHFQVSVYPSHTVLQGSLTVLLAGIYLATVGLFARLLGGDASFTVKAFLILVCLVLLTMVLLSDRVRLYTRRFVSRHFQRPLYDYRAVWRTFIEGTARRVEQTELCEAVVKLVSDTFHALSVSIWVLEERKQKLIFAASTSLSKTKADHLVLETSEAAQVIGGLSIELNPIDLDISKQPWASALRRLQPSEFPNGGNRVCVPLFSGGELLGVILLCDRVGGTPFLDQDFDLLKSISDQAAASLLNIQLSQKVLQAKQLEAFQSMSAFFVHDLKNTASTLSLMLQNLPVHFADPQFREDALRGVSKTVTHINDLISRLSLLRQELTTRTADCDLNELVKSVVGGEDLAEGLRKPGSNKTQEPRSASTLPRSDAPALFHPVTLDLRPVPRVRVDHGQIQNVLTNLVLNAREAIGADGRITVQTARRNGWIILSVSDNGCGMSRDFIDRSLFRPFQSTKKKGIGIGMFQCKIIVEAHGGQIEVESEPGKGTSFRVLLPVAPEVNH